MENIGIFIAGLGVTLMVAAGLATLLWAAVQDGRAQQAHEMGMADDRDRTPDVARLEGGGLLEPVTVAAGKDVRRA